MQVQVLEMFARIFTSSPKVKHFIPSRRTYSVSRPKMAHQRWKPTFVSPQTVGPRFIRKILNENAEKVAVSVCGRPNLSMSNKTELRYGARGSLCISLSEDKRGVWFNFETGESGDMLDLLQIVKNLSHAKAYKFAECEIIPNLGQLKPVSSEDFQSEMRENERMRNSRLIFLEQRKSPAHNQILANKLFSESESIEGSIAEKYLKMHRKIIYMRTPHLRYHPSVPTWDKGFSNTPALLAVASTPNSAIHNVQVTYLDQKTFNKVPNLLVSKRTYGSFRDPEGFHMCTLNEEDTDNMEDDEDRDTTFVSEGVETGLSVVQAYPNHQHFAVLGKYNFNNLDTARLNSRVVLIWDNDGVAVGNDPVFSKCAKRLLKNGNKVSFVCPPLLKGKLKTDMNDVLKAFGSTGVKNIIEKYKRNVVID